MSPPDGPAAAAYYQNSLAMSVTSHNMYSLHGRSNASSSAGVPVIPPVHFSNDTEKRAKRGGPGRGLKVVRAFTNHPKIKIHFFTL